VAKVVLGLGTSHGPLLTFGAEYWMEYSKRDRKNQRLNLSNGTYISYDELEKQVSGRYAAAATVEEFQRKEGACHESLDRLAAALETARPDVVVIVTDDESELFSRCNTPAVSIYYGQSIITRPFSSKMIELDAPPPYFASMVQNFAMEKPNEFPAAPGFARELIERMIQNHIDVGAASQVEEPTQYGLGHGIGFVIRRLFGNKPIPVVPVLLNTYYPPNAPLPARCFEIGRALRAAIEASTGSERVAIVASGGLSHFVVDEGLDRKIIAAIEHGHCEDLRALPVESLNSGSSEIRNWIALAGAMYGFNAERVDYQPLYRTPAGTGLGAAFALWKPAQSGVLS
jgi:hypothetical protein